MYYNRMARSIMFHVRRRPADGGLRKRKKKPGSLGTATGNNRDPRSVDSGPVLVELGPDGSTPHVSDTSRTLRLANDVMEVGSANGIALQLYGPHIQPRHAVIANTDGLTSITPCHADAHTYVNGQRIHQTTILSHGSLVKFGHSNTYRFLDLSQEGRPRHPSIVDSTSMYDRSPRALSPSDHPRENFETTFDLEGNVETVSTASGAREDNRSLGSSSENRVGGIDRYSRGQDPILPAVLEFPEDPQEQFLARVITHLDVSTPTFRLAPAYTLYLCARYRASTHYRPELTPTERAHKLTLLLQHAAMLVRHTIQDRSTESASQAFWLANASELLHFLKSDRHVSAFSLQAQDTLADAVQLAFRNLVACLTDELNSVMDNLTSETGDDHPRDIINTLSNAMNLLRKCRVNAALTIQLFSQLFHWISARSLSVIVNNPNLCNRSFGMKLFNRLRNLQPWAESQGLELAAECHLSKIVQCAHLLQASKHTPDELANLSAACFKLNSLQLRALLTQYKGEPGEQVAPAALLEQAARAAEGVADELARAEGREVRLHEDPAPPLQLLLPDDGFSCDVVQGVPVGLADFLQPLQASGLCRLAAQPTSSGHWTVYMNAPRPPSALSSTQPEVQVIRLHKAGGGMGLSIVAAKGAGQERLGIYIKSVVPGGAADRDGRLTAGDQLLSVDGQSLLGITQEKAAEFLVRTGSVVTLEVAKGGAVYHGLATLLQQPSPTPHRGPRRMSERDLPSRVDAERTIPSSKSVPALHHISPNSEQPRTGGTHDMFNPGYSRTSSNNSINTNSTPTTSQNGIVTNQTNIRSRSTHNLNQQDSGFYQNLSVYRNKMPSPQQLGERTSALRSSQNSLQSSLANSQRPTSAYYPQNAFPPAPKGTNLNQSIPNLKSPPSIHRLHTEDSRSGSFPLVNQHSLQHGSHQQYSHHNQYIGQGPSYTGTNQIYSGQTPNANYTSPNYSRTHEDINHKHSVYTNQPRVAEVSNSYISQNPNSPNYGSMQHMNGPRQEESMKSQDLRYNTGLLREDVLRQSHINRNEEVMRYPTTNNPRIQEAQIQHNRMQDSEMRTSRSEDMLRQHTLPPNDISRYASSGNIRNQEISRGDVPQTTRPPEQQFQQHRLSNDDRKDLRGQAKLAEMGEEVRRRQNRVLPPSHQPQPGYYGQHYNQQQNYHSQVAQNAHHLQNLNLNQPQPSTYPPNASTYPAYNNSQPNSPTSPNYPKSPPLAPKPFRKQEDPPDLPPSNTHPLYTASLQDPPKMSFYPNSNVSNKGPARDPWAREEQERQAEVRREQARQWQEHQIRELLSISNRTSQQEEQLQVLQLEREFQRRALEAAEQDDEDTEEKESPSSTPFVQQPAAASVAPPTPVTPKQDIPTSILKPGVPNNVPVQLPEPEAPPPPERGSSYVIMSIHNKEGTKRVTFNDTPPVSPPTNLALEESVREDPNSFIRQAESMLASPTTPTDGTSGITTATPGVIGAQEVYRDPRTRRLAEQAQQKMQTPVPEKLSFKEKMKMFAMETGESGTPRDKSKISRAQRDIDNIGSPSSNLVH